jgi:DNA-directed RNA polymerase specialized sigma24 family protein
MVNAASPDTELVQACLGGDREAFAQIVTRYQAVVASVAYNATGSIAQSEDLAQETFLVAWQHLKRLEQPGKLRAWLCGIARRTAANALRRLQRETFRWRAHAGAGVGRTGHRTVAGRARHHP